ncbi:MAG TPA: LD-carboxypeptidase [Bacteroidota bacterium]|nr:LD-carboxypeptidase [Bacteroidota bacterium]
MKTLKPKALKPGDVIGLIAPASAPPSQERIEKGFGYLERLGYRVKLGKHVRSVRGFLAGTDAERAEDINEMFRDRNVSAIIALRGGYGTPRLLPLIDYPLVRRNPKVLVGYSDLTALQLALCRKTGLVSFSGPMAGVEMYKGIDPFTEENFWRMVTSTKKMGKIGNPDGKPFRTIGRGKVSGRLIGGNLSLISSIIGSPYLPSFKNSIFYFEEVEEESYRFDRMLNHAALAGILRDAKGILIGELTDVKPDDPSKPFLSVDEIIADHLSQLRKPVLAGLCYGHVERKLTMPVGIRGSIDAGKCELSFLEAGVE